MESIGSSYTGGDWRKLLSTRRGTVIVAVACALVAAGILLFAAARYRDSVASSGKPETILVAAGPIQKGTPGDVIASDEMFQWRKIDAKQVSAGAIADTAALHGRVAAVDISPGAQLTMADFTVGGGVVSALAPDERAIEIPLDTAHGLVGVVQPGDRVDVYGGFGMRGGVNTGAALRLLVPNVPVLEVGRNAGGAGGVGGQGVNQQSDVVIKVSADDAGKIAYASDYGRIWLILRGANATGPNNQQVVWTLGSLLLGSQAARGARP